MTKLTIDSVCTKKQIYPIILNFKNEQPSENLEYPCAIFKNDDGNRIIATEIYDVVYAGEEKSEEDQTFILARNRITRKVRLIETGAAILKRVNLQKYSQKETNELDSNTTRGTCQIEESTRVEINLEIINHEKYGIKEFQAIGDLKKRAPERNTYICGDCETVFKNKDLLIIHLNSHKSVEDVENGKIVPNNHNNNSDKSKSHCKNFEESNNNKGINISIESNVDSDNMTESNTFICDYCKRVFLRKKWFISHIISHQEKEKRKLKKHSCIMCDQQFLTNSDRITHEIEKHELVYKYYSCPDCNFKTTTSSYKLALHLSTHSGFGQFKCEICSYETNHKSNLKKHILTHTQDRPYKCTICDAKFKQLAHLKKHKGTHNKSNTSHIHTYNCKNCEYSCQKSNDLKVHSRIHTGEKPFQCTFCESKFARRNGLTRHLKIHMGVKTHKCTKCDAQFKQLGSLKRHMIIHKTEKPFKCETCSRCFSDETALKRHFRCHTGEKPYKCTECRYSSAYSHDLKRHIKTHTAINLS